MGYCGHYLYWGGGSEVFLRKYLGRWAVLLPTLDELAAYGRLAAYHICSQFALPEGPP